MKTLKFSNFATGEGAVDEIFISNASNVKEAFFNFKNITDVKIKEWYEIGLEEYENIPYFVTDFLSAKAIAEIVERDNKKINVTVSYFAHAFV